MSSVPSQIYTLYIIYTAVIQCCSYTPVSKAGHLSVDNLCILFFLCLITNKIKGKIEKFVRVLFFRAERWSYIHVLVYFMNEYKISVIQARISYPVLLSNHAMPAWSHVFHPWFLIGGAVLRGSGNFKGWNLAGFRGLRAEMVFWCLFQAFCLSLSFSFVFPEEVMESRTVDWNVCNHEAKICPMFLPVLSHVLCPWVIYMFSNPHYINLAVRC